MLYDGMIRKMEETRQACLEGRIEDRWNASQKAARIVDALHASLDHDLGGEVARSLERWYTMIGLKIQQVNISNDPNECNEIIKLLRELRGSWDFISVPTSSAPPVRQDLSYGAIASA